VSGGATAIFGPDVAQGLEMSSSTVEAIWVLARGPGDEEPRPPVAATA
ncbi:MAG: hypothetical protein GWM90_22000, partial [Gemmatimonadetes bacterium]|nr:hypothetical protein [Gemmatimonadota bacterium]NIQ57243.1 hypothetical protein [Gemmatimonadota bacterium]NIU80051.1 hypothetical protein [Gammaproteobacteria bacterium]NIX46656.1 hypothetical protein [Gemmatimonadota bacterium]NIY12919.1 hypothetical protein [Gemmatimonadota bacterium]